MTEASRAFACLDLLLLLKKMNAKKTARMTNNSMLNQSFVWDLLLVDYRRQASRITPESLLEGSIQGAYNLQK